MGVFYNHFYEEGRAMMNAERRMDVLARKERIDQLKARAEELCKGPFSSFMSDECPLEIQEAFWRNVVEIEEGGMTTLAKVLEQGGLELTPADTMTDEQLKTRLWLLIGRMADLRCFLTHTDHLSDHDLYVHLLEVTLKEEIESAVLKPHLNSAYHYDLIGGGSDEDIQVMLRYYSTEEDREQWHDDFPDDIIPPMSIPPYDRDRLLPKWDEQ
jgi:hypothetical protein